MPWSIHERDGKFCVVKDADGSVVHCHPTREKALAQQRALYANEPTVNASLELDTSALMAEFMTDPEPVRIEVSSAPGQGMEQIVAALSAMADRIVQSEERQTELMEIVSKLSELVNRDQEILVSSMGTLTAAISEAIAARPDPVVNVTVPEPIVNVSPPQVHVTVEAPEARKKVIVERDPLTGLIASAEILSEDVNDQL